MMFQTEPLAFNAEEASPDDDLESLLRIGWAHSWIGHGHLAEAFFDQRSRSATTTSGLGQKRKSRCVGPMSALPPKADIGRGAWHVRFVPEPDIVNNCGTTSHSGKKLSAFPPCPGPD